MDNPEKLKIQDAQDKVKQNHNIIYDVHHNTQANTNEVNKTSALIQKTRGKDNPNIVTDFTTRNLESKDTYQDQKKTEEQHGPHQKTGGELR